jgi:LAS superfamily LD-carboxypeptidase LdcB
MMKMLLTNTTRLAVIVLALGLFSGCASKVEIQNAQDAAMAAQRTAEAAQTTADAANQKAERALQQAAQAKQAADECSAKCDRMFEKSQVK